MGVKCISLQQASVTVADGTIGIWARQGGRRVQILWVSIGVLVQGRCSYLWYPAVMARPILESDAVIVSGAGREGTFGQWEGWILKGSKCVVTGRPICGRISTAYISAGVKKKTYPGSAAALARALCCKLGLRLAVPSSMVVGRAGGRAIGRRTLRNRASFVQKRPTNGIDSGQIEECEVGKIDARTL